VKSRVIQEANMRSVSELAGTSDTDRGFIVSNDTDKSDNVAIRGPYCVISGFNPSQPLALICAVRHDMTQIGDTDRARDLCRFIL
jgi:hypothetical protein